MRARYEEFRSKGATIVAIGMGNPPMAAHFRDEFDVPFPLIVDHDKATYRALEMRRGNLWDVAGPHNWMRFARGIVTGHGVARAQQDVLQMAGVVVAEPGGGIVYLHRASAPVDNPPIDDVLGAIP